MCVLEELSGGGLWDRKLSLKIIKWVDIKRGENTQYGENAFYGDEYNNYLLGVEIFMWVCHKNYSGN